MEKDRIKAHFQEEAEVFDALIRRLIPDYEEMVDILVSCIPFPKERTFTMIDLGCGTGTISRAIREVFPNVEITCLDLVPEMLEKAAIKLGEDVTYIEDDFNHFDFPRQYDLIASSLALHHLENNKEKKRFYERCYAALKDGGMFINLDVLLGADDDLDRRNLEKWCSFLEGSMPKEEIAQKWLPTYRAEDHPASLMTHLRMMTESGFSIVDVPYKRYHYGVYLGKK